MNEYEITQAIILCAGFGRRLRPITDTLPKVMLPLGGKALLQWHIERLRDYGIEDIFINLHHLPERVIDYFGDGRTWRVKITYSVEKTRIRGTAGGLLAFRKRLKQKFIVLCGDVFSLLDYTALMQAFTGKPLALGIGLIGENDHPWDSELVKVDDTGRVTRVYIRPHKSLPATYECLNGIYLLGSRFLQYIPRGRYCSLERTLESAVSRGEIFYGYESSDYVQDIGTWERYRSVEQFLSEENYGGDPER